MLCHLWIVKPIPHTHTQSGKITLCNHINVILYTKRVRIKNNCYHFVSTVHFDTELFLLINNTLFLVFKESFGERLLFLPAWVKNGKNTHIVATLPPTTLLFLNNAHPVLKAAPGKGCNLISFKGRTRFLPSLSFLLPLSCEMVWGLWPADLLSAMTATWEQL